MSNTQSWYKDFTRRLEATNQRTSQAPSNNVMSSIYDAARVNLKPVANTQPQGVVDHLKDWGGRILDVMSRPGYAVGGVLNAATEKDQGLRGDFNAGDEFMAGLTGKTKDFYHPFSTIAPEQEGDSNLLKGAKWAGDFLMAMGTDPTSYIPGSAIAKGLKMGSEAAGLGKVAEALKAGNKPTLESDFLRGLDETPFTPFGEISDKPAVLPKELLQGPSSAGSDFKMPGDLNWALHPQAKDTIHPPITTSRELPAGNAPAGLIEAPPRIGVVDEAPPGFNGVPTVEGPAGTVFDKPDNFEQVSKQAADFAGGLRKPAGLSDRDHLHTLQLVRDSISHSLRTIKGTFNASDIKSPWRTIANDAELPKEPIRPSLEAPVAPQGAGQSMEASVYSHAVKRHIADSARHFNTEKEAIQWSRKTENAGKDAFVPSTGSYVWDGQVNDINWWLRNKEANGIGDLSTLEGLTKYAEQNPGARIALANTRGGTHVSLGQYIQHYSNKPIAGEIKVNGKSVSATKYRDAQLSKWEARAKGATPEEMAAYEKAAAEHKGALGKYELDKAQYEKAFADYSPTAKSKPTREELQNFLRDNKIVLSKAEKKKLLNSANLGEKSFHGTLNKLATETRRLNVESLDELVDMVKSGRVDKSVLDNIYTKLGVSTLGQAKKKLEVMDNAIARLQEKDVLRTKKELTDEAARKIDKPVSEGGFDPAVVGEVPREVPEPRIPVKEVVQTKGKTPSVSQSEAAVDRATTPDIAALLDPEAKNRVFIAAKKAVDYEWTNWKKKYPHKTNRGAGRTDTLPGAGQAHWYGEFNAKKQYTFFKYALQSVQGAAGKAGVSLKGAEGATTKYNKIMPMLKAHDDLLRSYGLHPAAVPGGGYPISLFDVLSILPQKWVERHFFNTGRQVTTDEILRIAQAAVDTKLIKSGPTEWGDELTHVATDLSGFSEVVRGILGKNWTEAHVGSTAEDFSQKIGEKAGQRELNKTSKKHGFDPNAAPANYASDAQITGDKVAQKTFDKGTIAPIVNEDFIKAVQEKVAYNSAKADIQYGNFVKRAKKEQVDKFVEAVTAAKTNDEVFNVVDGARKSVNSILEDSATIIPTKAAAQEVKDTVELATANPTTEIAAHQMAANHNATTALKSAQAEQEVAKSLDDLTQHLTETFDLSEGAQLSGMARMVHSIAPHISEGDLRKILLNNDVLAGHITAQFSRQLGNFERRVGKERVTQLFNDVRLGHTPSAADAADHAEMQTIISRIFSDGENGGWSLAGNGIHPRHLNSNLRHFKISDQFNLPTTGSMDEIYNAWKNFETEDPLNLLSVYHAAVQKTIAEKNMGAQISNYFGSARYQPGMGRVVASSGKSRIAHLINTDLYYPKDVIQNMYALDKTLAEMAKPGTNNKMLRLFDSATHAYKAGLTIYRPGHHMRNLYGDVWLGAMDGVYSPAYYKRAKQVMSTRANHYKDYNFNSELGDMAKGTDTAVSLTIGGQRLHLSNDDVYRLAAKHGLLPNYSTIEDLGVGTKSNEVGDTIKKISPFGGKVHNAAADFSEYRDHWVRIAHFLKVLEKDTKGIKATGKGRDAIVNALDEAAAHASNRVQKWHPNGSDNTKFERDVLRRGVLFYSWIRKAIPLVVETAVIHPGRFLAFPKAMYTLAETNGIDLNGFSDPFPTDQLFPAWLGGTQGPQFGSHGQGYIGMRAGIPMMDILDQYFASPGTTFQTVMSGTNPLVKIPYELSTGKTAQGVPVDDKAKYLLGQVPFGNFVNTMLDKPVGTPSASDAGYSPTGIRDPKALATVNLLTGLGLMDMSKPSYIKSGEFDLKYGRQGG